MDGQVIWEGGGREGAEPADDGDEKEGHREQDTVEEVGADEGGHTGEQGVECLSMAATTMGVFNPSESQHHILPAAAVLLSHRQSRT